MVDATSESVLLTDGTWITFPHLLAKRLPRTVEPWVFTSQRAAQSVRRTFASTPGIWAVPV